MVRPAAMDVFFFFFCVVLREMVKLALEREHDVRKHDVRHARQPLYLPNKTQTLHGTAIYAYIGVVLGITVGIYGIHGVSGEIQERHQLSVPKARTAAAGGASLGQVG